MTESRNSPKQQQVDEWIEGSVSTYFLSLIRSRLDRTWQARANVFYMGEPQRTQENKVWLLGEESVLQDIIDAFESKDLSVVEEVETDEEHIRHSPLRRPRTHPAG